MTDTASIEVVCPGMLEVLSVGKGDLKITVGGDDPAEVAKGRRVIQEMLKKGYGIFVELEDGTLARVKRFDPKHMVYVISDVPEEPKTPAKRAGRRPAERKVPVAGSRAKAIGRTAGG